jgi:hypothetical protein
MDKPAVVLGHKTVPAYSLRGIEQPSPPRLLFARLYIFASDTMQNDVIIILEVIIKLWKTDKETF